MKFKLSILWLVSVLGAYYLGVTTAPSIKSIDEVNQEAILSPESSLEERLSSHNANSNPDKESLSPAIKNEDLDLNRFAIKVEQVLNKKGALGLNYAELGKLFSIVETLDEQQLLYLLDELKVAKSQMNPAFLSVLGEFAKRDPIAALNFLDNLTANKMLSASSRVVVFREWAVNDASAAYEWYKTQYKTARKGMYSAIDSQIPGLILAGMAAKDLTQAIELMRSEKLDDMSIMSAMSIITMQQETEEDHINLMSTLGDLNEPQYLDSAFRMWATTSPEQASAWLESYGNPERSDKLNELLFGSWIMSEPLIASNHYFANSATEQNKNDISKKIVQRLATVSPEDGLAWIRQTEGIDKQSVIYSLLSSAIYSHGDFVEQNISLLESSDKQLALSRSIMNSYYYKSPEKARAFVERSLFKDQLTEELISKAS